MFYSYFDGCRTNIIYNSYCYYGAVSNYGLFFYLVVLIMNRPCVSYRVQVYGVAIVRERFTLALKRDETYGLISDIILPLASKVNGATGQVGSAWRRGQSTSTFDMGHEGEKTM